jgi:hypothetical protein
MQYVCRTSRGKINMKTIQKTAIGVLSVLLLSSGVGAAQAAKPTPKTPAPVSTNAGPSGDMSWEGFNWNKRSWGGGPHYNGQWSKTNVSNPDKNGYVKLSITNPTGTAPIAAEMQTTRQGFGYGTYSTVVEKNINSLQKEVVWGCLFTYDPEATPGMNEIDLCEASAWGGGAAWGESWPVTQGHGYWFDANAGPGLGNDTVTFPISSSPILTHKMVWEPGKITFETYEGEGYSGKLLKQTVVQGDKVPVPARERVHFNFWVTGGGGGNPNAVKPDSVTVRDFSFTPRAATAISVAPTLQSAAEVPSTSPTNSIVTESKKAISSETTAIKSSEVKGKDAKDIVTLNGGNSAVSKTLPEVASVKVKAAIAKSNNVRLKSGSYKIYPVLG